MTAPDIPAVSHFGRDEKMDRRAELDVEDSYYLLHALESEAFSCVVTAMRAQGMLTEYKQILLDHLKVALFVSDATYKAEMRRAANDEVLSKIAETLNPSYDSFVQWGLAANDVIPPAFNQIPLYADQDMEGLDVAGQLLRLANSHNSAVDNYNDALHELITLPKAPFVPEKLRVLLRETEFDSNERVDLNFDENVLLSENRNKKYPTISEKRIRKMRTNQKSVKQESSDVSNSLDIHIKSECVSRSSPNSLDTSKHKIASESIEGKQTYSFDSGIYDAKQAPESSCKAGEIHNRSLNTLNMTLQSAGPCGIAQNMVLEKTQQKSESRKTAVLKQADGKEYSKLVEEGKGKRKKQNQKENVKDTCARVRPFLFELGSPGQAKPPRGNPDKRAAKRSSPTFSCPPSTNGIPCAAGLSPQSYTTSASSRSTIYPSPNISGFSSSQAGYHGSGLIIKRMRTSSSGEPNNSHNGYYSRTTEPSASAKSSQLPDRSYSRVLLPPSQSAAAWSNPTRPYYGNPSAAAMGVTVRSSSLSNNTNSLCTSNAGTSVEKILQSSQQIGSISDSQQFGSRHFSSSPVFVALSHQPNKTATRRSSYSSKSSSVASSVPIHVSPVPNGGGQGSSAPYKNPPSPGEQCECSYRSNSSSTSHSSSASVSSMFSSRYASNLQSQNVVVSQAGGSLSHPEGVYVQNSLVMQDGRQTVLIDKGGSAAEITAKDDASNSMNSDDCASTQEMRLECDEVMAPEHRCVISPRSSGAMSPLPVQIKHVLHAGDVRPLLLSYEDDEQSEIRLNRVVQSQFMNGLLHQDDQELIGLITSEQCIR